MKNELIHEKLKTIPTSSGVYIMRDKEGNVIYVGKAKNLKNRVSQYFRNSPKPSKVQAMVNTVFSFDYYITLSEEDALALENNLIKKYQPFYNILLKDGKTFPYIKVTIKEDFPCFEVTRKIKKDGSKYFGPYISGISPHELLKTLTYAFKIRTCKEKFNETKHIKRECLNYSLGLCGAPCTGKMNKSDYKKEVEKAINFLNGNDDELERILKERMKNASEALNFEVALKLRERLKMIEHLKTKTVANMPKTDSKDCFAYITNGLSGAISVIMLRNGKILGLETYSVIDASLDEASTLSNFISQYYQKLIIPSEIILSHDIEDKEALTAFLDRKIKFITNPKGANKMLLEMAKKNALEHLEKSVSKEKQKYNNTLGALEKLKERLNLSRLPRRMECYDISHISGTNKVASMVVFINGEASKKDYRKFKIKTVVGNNDFASLQEALLRRLTRLKNQEGESFSERPDLLIIDGGKGQLSSCCEILKELKLTDIDIISLAKRLEEVYVPDKSEPYILGSHSSELKLLERIRDEAHRFAITYHRNLRTKSQLHSELDEIPGVGKVKKQNLLAAFKTTEEIKKASIDELNAVKGIDLALANKIYKYFRS